MFWGEWPFIEGTSQNLGGILLHNCLTTLPAPKEHGEVPALLLAGVPEGLRLGPPFLLLRRLGVVRVEELGAPLVVLGGLGRVEEGVGDDAVRAGVETGVYGLTRVEALDHIFGYKSKSSFKDIVQNI